MEKRTPFRNLEKPINPTMPSCLEGSLMGGGKKKPTLSQMAKAQLREESKAAKRAGPPSQEKKTLRILAPDFNDKGVLKEIEKMKVLTPYSVASRFNVRLSIAKDFLEELQRQGIITLVSRGRNVKIYKPQVQ